MDREARVLIALAREIVTASLLSNVEPGDVLELRLVRVPIYNHGDSYIPQNKETTKRVVVGDRVDSGCVVVMWKAGSKRNIGRLTDSYLSYVGGGGKGGAKYEVLGIKRANRKSSDHA